jgi:hypothetical protein
MNPAPSERKRDRRTYSLRADAAIYAALAKYTYLTVGQATGILGRNPETVQKRFQVLHLAGHLNRVRESLVPPYVYFLDREGARLACDLGELAAPHYVTSKSRMIVNHDLEITKFHMALEVAAPAGLAEWRQWRDDLRDSADAGEGAKAMIPDAYFVLNGRAFFLEIVKSYESEYVGGRSNIEQKLALYLAYRERFRERYGMGDFRVLWVLPTLRRVQLLIGKVKGEFPNRKFWLTDEASYRRDVAGKIWWTPKDFGTRTYSLFGEES